MAISTGVLPGTGMRTWRKTNSRRLESTNEIEMMVEVWEKYLHSPLSW